MYTLYTSRKTGDSARVKTKKRLGRYSVIFYFTIIILLLLL